MGNCASARAKQQHSVAEESEEEKYLAAISTLAKREQELSHLQKQLEATTAYAQGVAHEASNLRERLWSFEEQQRQSSLQVRELDDGMIIRPIVPTLDGGVAEAIRQRLHEFLMWEKDEVCEKSWQLEREREESEVGRRRVEEEVQVLKREIESVRARTPTPISDVKERVLGNIEAIRNGTWRGRAEGKKNAVLGPSREIEPHDRGLLGAVDENVRSGALPKQLIPGSVQEDRRPQMQQPIHLEELLKQKVEAFAIQERLVGSLIRERDELRTQITDLESPSRRRQATRTTYAETQMSASRRIQTIRRDPTDSAVDVDNCLDCEDLRAEIWCLSKSIERANVLNASHIEAREAAKQLRHDEQARHQLLLGAFQRKLRRLTAELGTSRNELRDTQARLRSYKAYVRKKSSPSANSQAATPSRPDAPRGDIDILKIQLGKAHTRIIELTASKEQAESRILSQQKELRETRRLAMRHRRSSAGPARDF